MFPAEWIYKDNYEFTVPQLRELLGLPKVAADYKQQLLDREHITVLKGRLHGNTMKDFIIRVPVHWGEYVYLDLQRNPLSTEQKLLALRPHQPHASPTQLDRIEAKLDALLAK